MWIELEWLKKKSHDELENIDDVNGPMSSTSIHGAVVTLSPVKKATFFDGLLADERSQIRLVGFQGIQQRKLNEYHKKLSFKIARLNLLVRLRGMRLC